MPTLTVIAGPNGSGKSTLTRALPLAGGENLLDPDRIVSQINPYDPRQAAVATGRFILALERRYLTDGVSFAVETTLASKRTLLMMRSAKGAGFQVHLLYVALDEPLECVTRVKDRVSKGGHDVPREDVLRRYHRSLANAPDAIRIADKAVLFDNSSRGHRRVLGATRGLVTWCAQEEPAWSRHVRQALTRQRS